MALLLVLIWYSCRVSVYALCSKRFRFYIYGKLIWSVLEWMCAMQEQCSSRFRTEKKIKGNNNKNKIWFHCDSVCEYMYICPSNNTYSIHFRIANSHSHHSIQLLENSKNVYFEYFSTFGYAEYFRSVFLCLSVFGLFLYLFFFLFNTLPRIDIESSIHNKCICAHICVNKLFFCTRIVRSAYFKLHQWIYFFPFLSVFAMCTNGSFPIAFR